MKTTHILRTTILLCALYISVSCAKESIVSQPEKLGNQITFTINVPSGENLLTRGISSGDSDDHRVSSIDVLLFDYTTKLFMSKVVCDQITNTSATSKTFAVTIPKGHYDITILANSHQVVNSAITAANSPTTKNKTEIHTLLVKSLPAKTANPMSGIWNAQPESSGFEPFPMWSEITDLQVHTSGQNLSATLVRMLAKVNLMFETLEVSNKLKLRSIMVCNFNKSGYAVPPRWDLLLTDGEPQNQDAINPKTDSREIGTDRAVWYNNLGGYPSVIQSVDGIQSCINEIFLFESAKPTSVSSQQQRMESTCLILEGQYDGDPELRYYRVDFARRNAHNEVEYLSLMRNHTYTINIKSVNTAGHPTPHLAYQSFAADLNVGVSSWSEGSMGAIAFDGQYILAVTPAEIDSPKEASTGNSLIIHTDYPIDPTISGVKYDDAEDQDWISGISSVTRSASLDRGQKKGYQVTFNCAENKTGKIRHAQIVVTAGRHLTLDVNVSQKAAPSLFFRIDQTTLGAAHSDISELVFPSGLHTSDHIKEEHIQYTWAPYSDNNMVNVSTATTSIDFMGGTLPPTSSLSDPSGKSAEQRVFLIPFGLAEIKDKPFLMKNRLYTFMVSNGVSSVFKTLNIRQIHYNAVADNLETTPLMDANERTFQIRSNCSWKIELKRKDGSDGDPGKVVQSFTPVLGGNKILAGSGDQVKYTLKNKIGVNIDNPVADIYFTITSTNPSCIFDPIELHVTPVAAQIRELSNSYIVAPEGTPILIPVKRANGYVQSGTSAVKYDKWFLGEQIASEGEDSKFGAKLVWTDVAPVMSVNGTIQDIRVVGSGPNGYIFIRPGKAVGNAVVAVTLPSETDEDEVDILWSWHIWVTEYHPYDLSGAVQGGTNPAVPYRYWMDRNLGATTNDVSSANSYGVQFQWGRKDPLPTAAATTGAVAKTIYDEKGTVTITKVAAITTFAPSVRFPLTIIDLWFGSLIKPNASVAGSEAWGYNGVKTIYDPCPKGYRVPRDVGSTHLLSQKHWGSTGFGAPQVTGDGDLLPLNIPGGIKWDLKGGKYPFAGYRSILGNTITAVGLGGYGWSSTSTASAGSATALYFTSGLAHGSETCTKGDAGSVRCVSE